LNGNSGLQQLHGLRNRLLGGLTQKQMDVLGHYDEAVHAHLEAASGLLKCKEECVLHVRLRQQGLTVITTEGEEMGPPGVMEA